MSNARTIPTGFYSSDQVDFLLPRLVEGDTNFRTGVCGHDDWYYYDGTARFNLSDADFDELWADMIDDLFNGGNPH